MVGILNWRARPALPRCTDNAAGQGKLLINTLSRRIHKCLKVLRIAEEKVVAGTADVTALRARLEQLMHHPLDGSRRALLKTSVLVESADKAQFVAYSLVRLGQIAIASHRRRRHGLQSVRAVFNHRFQQVHEPAAEMVHHLCACGVQGLMLLSVVRQAKLTV